MSIVIQFRRTLNDDVPDGTANDPTQVALVPGELAWVQGLKKLFIGRTSGGANDPAHSMVLDGSIFQEGKIAIKPQIATPSYSSAIEVPPSLSSYDLVLPSELPSADEAILIDTDGTMTYESLSVANLGEVGNVDYTGLADEVFLLYDSGSSKWKVVPIATIMSLLNIDPSSNVVFNNVIVNNNLAVNGEQSLNAPESIFIKDKMIALGFPSEMITSSYSCASSVVTVPQTLVANVNDVIYVESDTLPRGNYNLVAVNANDFTFSVVGSTFDGTSGTLTYSKTIATDDNINGGGIIIPAVDVAEGTTDVSKKFVWLKDDGATSQPENYYKDEDHFELEGGDLRINSGAEYFPDRTALYLNGTKAIEMDIEKTIVNVPSNANGQGAGSDSGAAGDGQIEWSVASTRHNFTGNTMQTIQTGKIGSTYKIKNANSTGEFDFGTFA